MDLSQKVLLAGVVGAGGAGFPTHIKINTKAKYYIINAAECEPLIETDKFLMRTFADDMIKAIDMVADNLEAPNRVIALKAKYKEEIKALNTAILKANSKITLFLMETFYPAGDEQMIVRLVTGTSVPERGLPLDVGAVVNNVGTVLNVLDASEGKPVIEKYLSITGAVAEAIMVKTPIGTPILECISAAKLLTDDYAIILGGPMMGTVVTKNFENLFVTKTTGNILILPKDHYLIKRQLLKMSAIKAQIKSACIQCKFCTELCPRYLTGHRIRPHLVMRNLYREDLITDDVEFEKAFGDAVNCCDCGICEMFACPMMLSPRKVNGYMKIQLRNRNINVERNLNPVSLDGLTSKTIPTDRLIARLNLSQYADKHASKCIDINPKHVSISLKQHIGAPAIADKKPGDKVLKSEIIGRAKEGALSTNIHASIDGIIKEVNDNFVIIES